MVYYQLTNLWVFPQLFRILFIKILSVTNFIFFLFFFDNPGCPIQLTRTMINPRAHWTPYKPNEQVRHRVGDMHAQKVSNLGVEKGNKSFLPLGHDL
jgi:hypothetical protein